MQLLFLCSCILSLQAFGTVLADDTSINSLSSTTDSSSTSSSSTSIESTTTSSISSTSTSVESRTPTAAAFTAPETPSPAYCDKTLSSTHATDLSIQKLYPKPSNGSYGWKPEDGYKFGNVIIQNNCEEKLFLQSVGVWRLGGPRLHGAPEGLGTPCDQDVHIIEAGKSYSEPYRITCPKQPNQTAPHNEYCADEDKVAGQGVAMKIRRTENATAGGLFQFEYALVKDPSRGPPPGDTFHRLNYDISLLDCGTITAGVTDFNATMAQHDDKVTNCPGYKDGVAVTFLHAGGDPTNCPPIYCNGTQSCNMIYTWDRTRGGEASLSCEKEHRGDMKVDLCVGKNETQKSIAEGYFDQWTATATNIPAGFGMNSTRHPKTNPPHATIKTPSMRGNPSTASTTTTEIHDLPGEPSGVAPPPKTDTSNPFMSTETSYTHITTTVVITAPKSTAPGVTRIIETSVVVITITVPDPADATSTSSCSTWRSGDSTMHTCFNWPPTTLSTSTISSTTTKAGNKIKRRSRSPLERTRREPPRPDAPIKTNAVGPSPENWCMLPISQIPDGQLQVPTSGCRMP